MNENKKLNKFLHDTYLQPIVKILISVTVLLLTRWSGSNLTRVEIWWGRTQAWGVCS